MKRILLFSIIFLCSNTYAGILNNIFKTQDSCSDEKILEDAIISSDVNSVLNFVKPGVNATDLKFYIELAQNSLGRAPKPTLNNKIVGVMKIALAGALAYKTLDHFKTEYECISNVAGFFNRMKSPHNILMDIAGFSTLFSATNLAAAGVQSFSPASKYKKQLLILLYLKSLNDNPN